MWFLRRGEAMEPFMIEEIRKNERKGLSFEVLYIEPADGIPGPEGTEMEYGPEMPEQSPSARRGFEIVDWKNPV